MRSPLARRFKRGLLPYAAAATAALALPAVAAAGGQQGAAPDPGQTLQGPVFQSATLSGDNTVTACADRPLKVVNDQQQSALSQSAPFPALGVAGGALSAATPYSTNVLNAVTPINAAITNALPGGIASLVPGGIIGNKGIISGDGAGGLFALVPANDVENNATNLFGLGGSVGSLANELNVNTISHELHGYIPDNQFPDSQNTVAIDPENNKCVLLNYAPANGNPLSSYLAGFTNLSIERGAVTDLRGTPNDYTQTLKLGGNLIAARTSLPGETIAAKVVSAIPRSATNSIDFNFSQPVDPTYYQQQCTLPRPVGPPIIIIGFTPVACTPGAPINAQNFSFITPSGEVVHGENLPGTSPQVLNSGTTVRISFDNASNHGESVMNAIEGVAQQGAALTLSLGTLTGGAPTGLFHGPSAPDVALMTPTVSQATTASTHPILKSASFESGKTWNLGWDQARTTPASAHDCVAVTVDGNSYPGDGYQLTGNNTEQISFPGVPDPQQVVRIEDTGGCVNNQEDAGQSSLPSEIDVANNHNITSGFTIGPDLLSANKQPTVATALNASTVGYNMDDQIAEIGSFPISFEHAFGLVLDDGEVVFDGEEVGVTNNPKTDTSQVIMQFKNSEVDHAVGAITKYGAAFNLFGHSVSNGTSGFVSQTSPPIGGGGGGGNPPVTTSTAPTLSGVLTAPAAVKAATVQSTTTSKKAVKKKAKKKAKHHKKAKKHKKVKKAKKSRRG